MEYAVNTNVNGRLMRFKEVYDGGVFPPESTWSSDDWMNTPPGDKAPASAFILGGCRLENPVTCPTSQNSQRRRSLLSSNRRRVLGLAPPVGGPVLQVAPPRPEDFTQREHAASKCSHTRDCFASAPVPTLCVRPDVELDPPANIVWCDACPSRHGQAPRRRSCVKDVCTCARAEPTGVLLGLEADAALRANISAIPWSGNSMCDQLMRLLGAAPNLGDLHPAERVLYMDCLSSRLAVMRFAATTGWDLPIDLLYSSEASLQYSIDMVVGVVTYITMTVLRNHTLYDVWGVLQGRGINPVSVLDWVNMFNGMTNARLPGLADRVASRLDQLAANYSGTPMESMTKATSRAVRGSAKLVASATSPLRRVVHGSAMRSVVESVGSAYGPDPLAPDGTSTAVATTAPPRTPSRVILQYALMRATTAGAIEPPPATTLRACPHAVGPGGRQLQWSFESNTPPGPTSSCFLIDWIVYDIVQAVRATMEYYRNILPRVSSRFTWVTQTYPTTPEPPQYPAIQPPSNATGCFPTRNVTNVVNGIIYAAEWMSIPVCTAVQFFEQLINNTKSNRTVFDDVALAIGCDITRIQQCTIRHDYGDSVVMWLGMYAVVSIVVSFYLPFAALFTWAFALVLFFAHVWWVYGVSPNCLPLIPTCFWDDNMQLFSELTPYPRITWSNCTAIGQDQYGNTIFVDCNEPPYDFKWGWQNLAFFLVRWFPDFARKCLDGHGWERTLTHWLQLRSDLKYYWNLVYHTDPLTVCRATTCFWLTGLNFVPLATGSVLAGWGAFRVAALTAMLIAAIFNFFTVRAAQLPHTATRLTPDHRASASCSRVYGHAFRPMRSRFAVGSSPNKSERGRRRQKHTLYYVARYARAYGQSIIKLPTHRPPGGSSAAHRHSSSFTRKLNTSLACANKLSLYTSLSFLPASQLSLYLLSAS